MSKLIQVEFYLDHHIANVNPPASETIDVLCLPQVGHAIEYTNGTAFFKLYVVEIAWVYGRGTETPAGVRVYLSDQKPK